MNFPVYTLSDSDSTGGTDSDNEDFLLGSISPTLRKTKNESKKMQSPTKSKGRRKTDKEKQRLEREKQDTYKEKLRLKEEKRRTTEEKIRIKNEKKRSAQLLKQQKPGECIKFITVFIDSSLLNCKFGGELLTALRNSDVKYTVREQQIPGMISWQRNMEEQNTTVPNHVVVIWMGGELINFISSNILITTVDDLLRKHLDCKLTIVIFGIEEYFGLRKISRNKEFKANIAGEQLNQEKIKDYSSEISSHLGRSDVEMALSTLQLMLNVQYKFFESVDEIGLFVTQFTKAMAELPYKLQKNKNQEHQDWFAEAHSKECVRVDNNGYGLLKLWQQQICQFPNVGLDAAQAIVTEYCSPKLLMEAYDKCSTQKEGEKLLQNIQIRRSQGPLSSVRRIGPELSKKLYSFFTTTDGKYLLSKEN